MSKALPSFFINKKLKIGQRYCVVHLAVRYAPLVYGRFTGKKDEEGLHFIIQENDEEAQTWIPPEQIIMVADYWIDKDFNVHQEACKHCEGLL